MGGVRKRRSLDSFTLVDICTLTENVSVFEPVLVHNLEAYKKLERAQIQFMIAAMLSPFVLVSVMLWLVPFEWMKTVTVGYLVVFGSIFGFLEIKKTLIFRRDLREQRERSTEGSDGLQR